MGYAKPTAARLIDQRARRRATQQLVEKYRDEFDALYRQHRANAETEAEELARRAEATKHAHGTPLPDEPPRLMPGARKPGETPLERIDVARCPHCIRHHDQGHVCRNCGAVPSHALTIADDGHLDEIAIERAMRGETVRLTPSERAEAARRMAQKGVTVTQIAKTLRMGGRRVNECLEAIS